MKKTVLADIRIDRKCEAMLTEMGYEIIKLPPSPYLAPPVASHPDMLTFIAKGRLICERRYFEANRQVIEKAAERGELGIVLADEELSSTYPHDVLFNASPLGEWLICRKRSVSETVRELYPEDALINVNQGYAKCATLTVGDSGVITADPSVAKAVAGAGLDILKLESHGVELLGYDSGFIGGASGDDGEHILFCGDLSRHPEGELIAEFCRLHRREPVSLSDEGLYDYGTLLFL